MSAKLLQSCPTLCNPLWTVVNHGPLSMGFSGKNTEQVACPSAGGLPNTGIEPASPVTPALQADSLLQSQWGSPFRSHSLWYFVSAALGTNRAGNTLQHQRSRFSEINSTPGTFWIGVYCLVI